MVAQIPLPPGYVWREGSIRDRAQVQQWLQATLQEAFPQQESWDHLRSTVTKLFDPPTTPCWWIMGRSPQGGQLGHVSNRVGCVWAGVSIDQVTNLRMAYIFLLRVDPLHRRQGLGRALVERIEAWAKQEGLAGVLLQVFAHNQPALELYTQAGFSTQGLWLHKPLETLSE